MPKLLWVALPLLAGLALLAGQALRGRPPSRRSVNIWSSLLLLAYVLVTAGLGIFWVANQQLPVFDWHYLFGYGTVLLVALHLVFNFPVAWRHLARPRSGAVRTAAPPAPGRRGVLGLVGAAAAAGVAFLLGLRHGSSELRIDGTGAPAAGEAGGTGAASGLALVERFHAFSSHSRAGVLLRAPGVDWGDAPPAFKHHPGAPRVVLPPPTAAPGMAFDLAALGAALWHTTGVTQARGPLRLRASPSSGALFSTELYIVVWRVTGLAAGVWHYDPDMHALERLAADAPDDAALGAPDDALLDGAAAAVVATAVFRRTGHKYRDRTYRYVLADLGHALENLRVASAAVGAQALLLPAFDESHVAATLGLDEAEEGVLAIAALRTGAGSVVPPAGALPTARWRPPPLAPVEASGALGVTAAVHAATSLRLVASPVGPAAAPVPAAVSAAQGVRLPPAPTAMASWLATVTTPGLAPALPAAPGSGMAAQAGTADRQSARRAGAGDGAPGAALRVIAARRSVRRFTTTPLALDDLAGVLAAMTEAGGGPVLSDAVRVNVVVHAVEGLAPGAYRHDAATRALLPRRVPARLRDAARAAALDQDVIGDGAAVFVLSIDRAVFAADPLGPARGYRHAFIEAGLMGERIYLEGGARGLGACAVGAFHDDEAAALVGIDPAREWVVHFAALGRPAG